MELEARYRVGESDSALKTQTDLLARFSISVSDLPPKSGRCVCTCVCICVYVVCVCVCVGIDCKLQMLVHTYSATVSPSAFLFFSFLFFFSLFFFRFFLRK